MQIWDAKWLERIRHLGVSLELAMRYMDDGRAFLFPLKSGWRWHDGSLMFCKRWEQEDLQLSPVERTKRAIHGTMMDLENFLKFTMETGEEFEGGWLPTLDTKLRVEMNNRVLYTHYEKPVASNTCVLCF